jgi:hypothetical protein
MNGASPEAKFFLLKYLYYYGTRQYVQVRVRDLVKEFGINDRGIKEALSFLFKNKYLAQKKVSEGGPGRPKQLLSPGEALDALVKKWSSFDRKVPHELLIEKLLETTPVRAVIDKPRILVKRPLPPNPKVLTNVRKLLLSTLLAYADQCGSVRDLSMTELASLIGLKVEQLRWHLKILKGSQYLFHYIPGMVVKGVKGKIKSVYIVRVDMFRALNPGEGIHTTEVMGSFERAVHLAHALKALNENSNRSTFRQLCMSQFGDWSSIYLVDKAEFENIVNSVDLFWDIGNTNGVGYERMCAFVGELAASLFVKYGVFDPEAAPSENDVVLSLAAEVANRRLVMLIGTRSSKTHGFRWLSRLALKLYREVSSRIKDPQDPQSANDIRIISCFICPWFRNYIAVHYCIEQRSD